MSMPIYALLAQVFEYPGEDFPEHVERACRATGEAYPAAAGPLREFADLLPWGVADEPLREMEEIFTRSFDIQAITTLDVGYVLFGDEYKRGELLVNLSAEHKAAGLECGDELGDHLSNLLRLVAVTEDRAMLDDLVAMIIAPGLRRMVGEFNPARVQAKEKLYRKHHRTLIEKSEERSGMYGHALRAVYAVLQADFTFAERETFKDVSADFLDSITRELEIEHEESKPQGQFQPPGGCDAGARYTPPGMTPPDLGPVNGNRQP